MTGAKLTRVQIGVLAAAFVPMLATGVFGGIGTYSNIGHAYGQGTALGALAAGEGATAVLALVLLGLTMLGQSSPRIVRLGLWALPAAAAVMGAMAAPDPGRTVIYALTSMGMSVSAEGMAFLARRIVVHTDGRDAENERRTADVVQALAYHRARATQHPTGWVRKWSELKSWRLARRVGVGDAALGSRLLDVQRERVSAGADAALASMFGGTTPGAAPSTYVEESTPSAIKRSMADLAESTPAPQVTLTRLTVPAPVAVDLGKSTPPLKPLPPTVSVPVASIEQRAVAAESTRPRRATGRVPAVAKSTRSKRTPDQLLDEARAATADWPDEKVTGEGIRRAIHTSPANARLLRDTLLAERTASAEVA
ncbi:conjugal transfer protein [Streptomyces sp. WAC05374]|uniref:conjugal transfer protein n=1 Tax=Streptomyces sp. WAC05374 TaxID=2487420 RepID=UPI000F87B730|nr:conjugal transfer protein [Streptomyces sp. WAC05374]RST19344.1 conjugal transfer protein [Streptomyces sp. WAC05374]TDF47662.1 conjugal transfer protein [Streptomyces sp. WAC05374]TDF48670.1 conjugal transfer protein [Streptomyces sp. WAC05374]TDF59080.1 conjugal transfer protein [Streptomyces sp. WAC05374]